VFSVAEVLPKKMPSSIAYRFTVDAGNANGPFGAFHKIIAISDDKTANIGSCQALVGTNMLLNQVYTCSYAIALSPAPIVPLVNTVRLTYDNGGNDLLASSSVVQGGGKCNSGNGNGSDPIQFTDPTAHCYGGDPGNSYNAGNKGGDEIPTSGGVPNPGGNNTP
jgi:hypothetical protein